MEDFAPMLLGEDPFRIEHIFQKLYRQSFWRVGAIGLSAISGIDQALWDIKGKALNVPVYELLGGRVRDRVVLSCSDDIVLTAWRKLTGSFV